MLAALPTVTSTSTRTRTRTRCKGSLHLMYELEQALCKISGMDAVTLQPAAGAHGEFTGMLIAKAYHDQTGRTSASRSSSRTRPMAPTPPARPWLATMSLRSPRTPDGCVDLEALKSAVSARTAAFMITNPNTLGIFEEQHPGDRQARPWRRWRCSTTTAPTSTPSWGTTSPGLMDFDIVHFNLHKTFATPHGGGGPGAGPVGVKSPLGAVPARAEGGQARRPIRARLRSPGQHRQGALLLWQLRRAGACLRLHPQEGRRRAQGRLGPGGAELEQYAERVRCGKKKKKKKKKKNIATYCFPTGGIKANASLRKATTPRAVPAVAAAQPGVENQRSLRDEGQQGMMAVTAFP